MKTRECIFNILAESDEVVSGEKISEMLGISRVSVWKHIKSMVGSGIPIESSAKGYLLDSEQDSLNPIGFGDRKDCIRYFDEISSTMDEAQVLARQGCPGFTVVVAERQTNGRGRMRRVWSSDEGGLYFSVVIRPDLPVTLASLVNLAAAVELSGLLRDSYGIEAFLKWPNDILVGDRKICGFLSQMETEGDMIQFLSIGIGLNVNNDPEQTEPGAISMKKILGRKIIRKKLLIGFLDRYEKRLENFDPELLVKEWKDNNTTIGRFVNVKTVRDTWAGTAVDIDDQGGLIIEMEDGRRNTIIHGDCFYR